MARSVLAPSKDIGGRARATVRRPAPGVSAAADAQQQNSSPTHTHTHTHTLFVFLLLETPHEGGRCGGATNFWVVCGSTSVGVRVDLVQPQFFNTPRNKIRKLGVLHGVSRAVVPSTRWTTCSPTQWPLATWAPRARSSSLCSAWAMLACASACQRRSAKRSSTAQRSWCTWQGGARAVSRSMQHHRCGAFCVLVVTSSAPPQASAVHSQPRRRDDRQALWQAYVCRGAGAVPRGPTPGTSPSARQPVSC